MSKVEDLRRAHAYIGIRDAEGWHVICRIMEEIEGEAFEKFKKLPVEKLTGRQAHAIKAQLNAFEELRDRIRDLEVLRENSKQRQSA